MLNHIEGEIRVDILPFKGFWLDIGRPEDYDYANKNYRSRKNNRDINIKILINGITGFLGKNSISEKTLIMIYTFYS